MPGKDGGAQRRRVPDSRQQSAAARPLRQDASRRGSSERRHQDAYGQQRRNAHHESTHRRQSEGYRTAPRASRHDLPYERQPQRSNPRYSSDRYDPRRAQGTSRQRPSSSRTAPPAPAKQSSAASSGGSAGGVAASVGHAVVSGFAAIGRTFASVWRTSKPVAVAIVAVVVLLVAVLFNAIAPHDKIQDGVHVGEIDVSGMTVAEATQAIGDKYTNHLNATTVYIFADEETANSADIELQMIENEALAEQLSFEEAQSNKKLWIASAASLEAALPSEDMAKEALELGNDMGFFERMGAAQEDLTVKPRATYDETLLAGLISDINLALGSEVVDYSLDIDGEQISVVEGKDGSLLDNEEFTNRLSEVLLVDASSLQSFVADVRPATYRINQDMANLAKEAIEAAVPASVEFSTDEKTVSFDRAALMGWVDTRASQRDDGTWYLEPFVNKVQASKDILNAVNVHSLGEDVSVTMDVGDDGNVAVTTSKDVALPNIEGSLDTLEQDLFGSYKENLQPSSSNIVGSISITTSEPRSSFGIDEALSYGLVTEFSSYTTQFTNTSSTVNRRDNIHLVADAIGNSVVKADGGSWSFLDHSGPMDEEDGYKEANQIVGGRMEQGVGGGVCQVATTVFNAVYEAGLDIDERHNHTLYTSSYPNGRDAAVSYPGLDLVWSNQTSSDVLLRTSYTDSSVTVTLVGVDPELEVVTQTSDWEEGKKHTTQYEVDEMLKEGSSYVKTAPSDGMEISVTRIVKDKDGNTVGWATFPSVYAPVNRLIAYGPGSDLSQIKQKYAEEDDE